jgi:protoheme IX farnesyltransferase
MLPVVAGKAATRRQILIYSLLLLPITISPVALGVCGLVYGIGAALLGLIFLASAIHVWRTGDDNDRPARRLFGYSIFYLFALFALMLAERLMGGPMIGLGA